MVINSLQKKLEQQLKSNQDKKKNKSKLSAWPNGNALTFYQILSTSTKKCMDISLKNLFVDMGLTGLSEHCIVP